tara:strand:- start:57 stop:455 length:399 start_codon:yes stop_codon:yes gene_type:complete
MKVKTIIFLFGILFCNIFYAQQYSGEELKEIELHNATILNSSSKDTSLAKAYLGLSEILYVANIDTLIPLCNRTIDVSKKNLAKKSLSAKEKKLFLGTLSDALNNIGYVYKSKGEIELALKYYNDRLLFTNK